MDKGIGLIFATAIISGFSIFLNAFGVRGFDSAVFTFSKNVLVAALVVGIIFGIGQWRTLRALSARRWGQLALIGLVGGSIPFLLFFKGLSMTSGTTSAFIHKTLFVFATVFAIVYLKEKVSKGWLVGAAILLVGNAVLLLPDLSLSLGHLLVLAATLLWAVENVLSKKALGDLSANIVVFGRMGIGSGLLFLYVLATGKLGTFVAMSGAQWGWIALTSLLLFGFVIAYYHGLATVKVSTATSILLLGSPITLALSNIFRDVPLGSLQLLGMASIVCGVGVMLLWRAPVVSDARR